MTEAETEIVTLAHEWDRAMVENNAGAISCYMADDWIIVGSDGNVTGKAAFLDLIERGDLTHSVMTSDDIMVRVYGDSAVLVSRGVSSGQYRAHSFREYERSSNVFVKQDSTWRCVLTHLSRLAEYPDASV